MPIDPTQISLKQLESMRAGARVAARTCMGIGPADRIFILTDRPTHGIGRLLAEEASDLKSRWKLAPINSGNVLSKQLKQNVARKKATTRKPTLG